MRQQFPRRGFLGLAGAAGALAAGVAAGCSGDRDDGSAAGKSVTITHIFGETTIPEPPTRVVCAGYTGQDDLLAVGVVPIAVTDWFGDQPFAVWPWARPKLGAARPVVLNLDSGIDVEQIAGLKPDLIVATNAGVDADTYQQLSAIAPTVPQSDGDAFFEPWKDQAATIGQAVHQAHQMQSVIDGVDRRFADVATAHPGFKDSSVLLLHGRLDRGSVVTTGGWRTEFLTRMGLVIADAPAVIGRNQLKAALGATDVLIWTTEGDDDRQALLADPDVAAVAARSIFTTKDLAGAIAFASPLSYPLVADQLPPLITKIVG
ncbi:MAG TPA: ABC transporter substrate-binding protein [Mycobacterium sp.]|nr:ABC transporter substrate-binding protein [Mycobacterium sp.]